MNLIFRTYNAVIGVIFILFLYPVDDITMLKVLISSTASLPCIRVENEPEIPYIKTMQWYSKTTVYRNLRIDDSFAVARYPQSEYSV